MPAQARLGDKSKVDSNAHGCPACPHTCVGPATKGSPNVFVNGKPAIRIGDTGVHSSCCGPNTWKAIEGAPHVFINGKAAHRLDDQDQHCGGVGKMIQGSPNVFTGNGGGSGLVVRPVPAMDVAFVILDEDTQEPVFGVDCKITCPDGSVVHATTDEKGRILLTNVEPGEYGIERSGGALAHKQRRPLAPK